MKKLSLVLSILALVISAGVTRAQAGHEYSPLVEKTVNYKNWKLPNITSAKDEDLRSLMAGKKLVMIVYFAPWCGNWRNEAPIAAKLYEKYKAQGFQVIGISEYANTADTMTFFGEKDPPYPVVSESISRDDKSKTAHYEYRQLTGDTRNWGSPWNIFLEPDKVNKTGEVLTEKAFVVNGELIEDEVDKYIASKLGPATAGVIQPCKN
ncbi:MAG TPA: TlpA disulfide reductase family protein [Pyrinomonadaceae bacterium]|jgi:thiol-disulfide isomerase/thioredoxin|nr:TlpA disulfide reductase family protein [Pyrinomonadaceae bacterium]